ncbi:hypothetical protein B0A48_15131 [Cryoendolithus antarcticus]|uniref:Tryptophan synthase beta chain-like PALP domain-containing protein n=1 Tax=Cryoendolithus antarcticus TaxID=1507870 RepID=A0A1V8SJG6_9PEZI|nr:hypothetical protein B0A48_15131 [Cryoendolithus antarcticus]
MTNYVATHLMDGLTYGRSPVLKNPHASPSTTQQHRPTNPAIQSFHRQLPAYGSTQLHDLPSVAKQLGFDRVFIKDESTRFGLPSFKIAGASWAVHQTLCQMLKLPESTSLAALQIAVKARSDTTVVTCTEGNWGRAVSRMAGLYGVKARIYVPGFMNEYTRNLIRGEGGEVIVKEHGSYDETSAAAFEDSQETGAVLLGDVAFDDYIEIPRWVSDGYSTILQETDRQVAEMTGGKKADVVSSSVGAGSWALAVVEHYRATHPGCVVVSAETERATSLKESLHTGELTHVKCGESIMNGMNCGTLSTIAWPALRTGVDISTALGEKVVHEAVLELQGLGINAGPCGAANLVALREACTSGALTPEERKGKIAVLYSTEGRREYTVPE